MKHYELEYLNRDGEKCVKTAKDLQTARVFAQLINMMLNVKVTIYEVVCY